MIAQSENILMPKVNLPNLFVSTIKSKAMISSQKSKNKNVQEIKDRVTIFFCLLRIKDPYHTDIVITFYVPDEFTKHGRPDSEY